MKVFVWTGRKKTPLVVGEKDADPELMRFLGARLTCNYPVCGSPPLFVVQSSPRDLFEALEKRGYCVMSSLQVQEHMVWILARPRVPDDDTHEIQRIGPNDKSVQVTGKENEEEPAKHASIAATSGTAVTEEE